MEKEGDGERRRWREKEMEREGEGGRRRRRRRRREKETAARMESKGGAKGKRLEEVFKKALESTLESCPLEKFEESFPKLNKEALRESHHQIMGSLKENCSQEFHVILEGKGLLPALLSLEELAQNQEGHGHDKNPEARTQKARKISELSPGELMKARSLEGKQQREGELRRELEGLEEENKRLAEGIKDLRKRRGRELETFVKRRKMLERASETSGKMTLEEVWEVKHWLSNDSSSLTFSNPSEPLKRPSSTTTTTSKPALERTNVEEEGLLGKSEGTSEKSQS